MPIPDKRKANADLPKPRLQRPASLGASSLGSSSETSSLANLPRAPTTLLSGALPQSLLSQLPPDSNKNANSSFSSNPSVEDAAIHNVPIRPRRLWKIQDTSLTCIPRHLPPLDPHTTVVVAGDVAPSVVGVRIAECLRKRSIAVEYDEETVTATAMTVDRCHFAICLWKAEGSDCVAPNGIVVHCWRVSGNPLTFHPTCQAILQAATGHSTGEDLRPSRQVQGLDFGRLVGSGDEEEEASIMFLSSDRQALAAEALEQVQELLHKDRLDTKLLGMERLVSLTCPSISGQDIALYCAIQILKTPSKEESTGSPKRRHQDKQTSTRRTNPWKILWKYIHMEEDIQEGDGSGGLLNTSLLSACTSSLMDSNVNPAPTTTGQSVGDELQLAPDELRHESHMRSYALRVLCNALSHTAHVKVLAQLMDPPQPLKSKSFGDHANNSNNPLLQPNLWNSLLKDLQGAHRPPSVVEAGHQLASVHEAALAVRCLRLLKEHGPASVVGGPTVSYSISDQVLEKLEVARSCGRSTHWVLQQETERTYAQWTEDVRSC